MLRGFARVLLTGSLGLLGSCALDARPAPGRIAVDVEPHVRDAFVAAWRKLPAPWRQQLGDVELHRAPALGVPAGAPLSALLLDRAALAYFANVERRIYVTDAGARLTPDWVRAAPTRAAVGTFLLDDVGIDPGEGEGDRVDRAWRVFVQKVFAWDDQAAPDPVPSVGDVAVLDRFLQRGVWRALGGQVPLEELLFHELAHAVQNHLSRMSAHMLAWGTLSDWRDRDDGDRADGYSAGAFAMEQPNVLVRLLLELPRGEATYVPHENARFLNPYTRYDLREDFAESSRHMAYGPHQLLQRAPAKFLFLNALGWSARLDVRNPGPLWVSADELEDARSRAQIAVGARKLLNESSSAPIPNPLVVAAVLRAHAELLSADDLPPPHPPIVPPADLPPEVLAGLAADRFTFTIDGVARQPAPSQVRATWDAALARWIEYFEFSRDLETMFDAEPGELLVRYAKEMGEVSDRLQREQRFDHMLMSMRGTLPDDVVAKLCRAEADVQAAVGRELTAARYRLLAGDHPREEWAELTAELDNSYAAVELLGVVARLHLEAGRRAEAVAAIERMPGTTWGAYRKVRYWLSIDEVERAQRVVETVEFSRLQRMLAKLLPDKGTDEVSVAVRSRLRSPVADLGVGAGRPSPLAVAGKEPGRARHVRGVCDLRRTRDVPRRADRPQRAAAVCDGQAQRAGG